jgi:gliding motility-associated-like protein
MTIVVNPITAVFTQVAPICSGDALADLPTTSNNGVTGTWSPAMDNTATTTYTFTPDAGQCNTTPTTMTIVVNPITVVFNQIAPVCSGDALVLSTTSDNGVTGTWSPTMNNTATTTYTFTPDAGQCATNPVIMTIDVIQKITPAFTAIAPICSGETSPVLPQTSNNGISGTWNPATVSNTATDTYTFTPTVGECGFPTTLSVTVYQSPTDIAFTTTDVVNDGPDGIIEIAGTTSGVSPFEYSINNGSFTTDTTYPNLLSGNYTITVRDSNGCEFNTVATINSICVFPNAISPNGDEFNQTFNLNGCNVGKLTLFNRYGREVNRYNNYSDQWDGTNDKGDHLPDGTYFYVAEIKDGTSKTGWIYVSR